VLHSWEVLAKILSSDETMGIVCDLGMLVASYSPTVTLNPPETQARRA
jgi:hypothetical protein